MDGMKPENLDEISQELETMIDAVAAFPVRETAAAMEEEAAEEEAAKEEAAKEEAAEEETDEEAAAEKKVRENAAVEPRAVSRRRDSQRKRSSGSQYSSMIRPKDGLLAAFFAPIVIMIIIFAGKGIFPFGEESFLRTDMYHQYAPFFSDFQYKLTHGGSLLYSWDVGRGVNFSALYLLSASPFNWLLIFVEESTELTIPSC
ncbi:MAG: YfhO family protein [Lachnospiraceae bacterium]